MDNAEEILQALEEFTKLKPKDIPKELDEYLGYVAKTGDPVYQWHLVKHLFHEKLSTVIKDFYETSPTIDLPPCPNVDPFNYERLRTSLLERLDMFSSAPFTVQRICELLTNPRKQYNRVDKFMRAIEKNILVVSTREPGIGKRLENDQTETVLNGIPDNKLSETDDRIINVCSDNLQFSNSADSTHMPVVLHACVIQEEVEISNSMPATATVITTDKKSWCEDNENEKDSDLDVKTEVTDNSEINVVSTSTASPNSELPKNSSILFTENEMKGDTIEIVKTTPNDMLSNERIGSSTPDSPDSPEPSSSEELCTIDNLSDESIQPEPNEPENSCSDVKQDDEETSEIQEEVAVKETDNTAQSTEEILKETPSVDQSNVSETSEITEEIERNEETVNESLELLQDQNQPDSSNDSYQSSSIDSKESSVDVENGNIPQKDEDLTNNSEPSTSEKNIPTEVTDVTSSQVPIQPEDETSSSGDLVVKEIEDIAGEEEVEDSVKAEELNCEVIEEVSISNVTNEETVVSSDECVSVQEVTEEQVESTTTVECTEIVETSGEVLEEVCEEQERKEGSIIHTTSNVSESENEPQTSTVVSTIEEISVDQTSCSTEDEAMDVDESSNQQMVTSEGENEAEPMDQSDVQTHS